MTYSRRSLRHIAYYALLLVLLMVVGSPTALAQPSVPPPVVGAGPPNFEDSNPKTPFDTREDYFKRFPFARNAFDHDNKEVHEWSTRVVEGPPDPSFFDTITDFVGNIGSSITNALGFGGNSGAGSSSNANQSPETRSQHSMPEEGASGPVHVTAYPFFIKFCNDNPYQGVCYWQAGEAFDRPRTDRDLELFENVLTTFGYPVSDTQFQLIQRENFQRLLELMYDPERYVWMATNTSQMQAASAANSMAGVSEQAFSNMVDYILDGPNSDGGHGGLPNVANENAATPMNLNALYRPVSAAYDVVMRSYKEIYVPMAILFLLPGAVLTQVKATVSKGFDLGDGNPFEGIIRSMVAIFLIPGTQVIVSYSIDVGNSMATTAEDWVDRGLIIDWQHELTYNVNPQDNHKNVIEPPEVDDNQDLRQIVFEGQNGEGGDDSIVTGNPNAGGGGGFVGSVINFFSTVLSWLAGTFVPNVFGAGGEGLGANVPEADTTQEEQLALSQVMQFLFNGATFLGALTIIILTAVQVVMICYLFLLGPLSAAFFAWPQLGEKLFRNVLASWLQAVITVSLWRFYWVLGLLIMTQRLLYINNPGGVHLGTGDLQWEVVVFVCILALMIYTSMAPFNYDPEAAMQFVDDFKDASIDTGKALASGGGEAGSGAGGAGGQGGQGSENSQPASGGGSSDSRTESPGGSSDQDLNQSDNATERVAGTSGDDSSGAGEDSSSAESSSSEGGSESMANDSPPDANAPPMESGGGGSGGGGEGAGETQAPPSAQSDAMMAGGAASLAAGGGGTSGESSEAGDAVASSGYESQQMPSDSAPVDRSPGDGSAQTGNYNQDADASQAHAGIASQAQSGGDSDSSGSGGSSSSPGEMNMTIGQEGDDSGGSSESPQPPNMGNIQPPPMTDSSDDD